jgi:hypothetical protein
MFCSIQIQVDGRNGARGTVVASVTTSEVFLCKKGVVKCAVNSDCCSNRCVKHMCARA